MNELVERLWDICKESHPGEGKRLVNLGIVMAPDRRAKPGES